MMRAAAIAVAAAVGGALLAPSVPLAADDPPAAATPVHAVLDASANPARAGEPVRLDSSGSDGEIVAHAWDLDGDGSFETDTGAVATAQVTPPAGGPLTVRVRVADAAGATDEATLALTVQQPAPEPVHAAVVTKKPKPEKSKPEKPKPAPKRQATTQRVTAAAATSVTIKDFAFAPRSISVHVGDSITWTNQDSAPHTATANDGSFETGSLSKGKSGSHTFTKAGTFAYICAIHPSMKGTVTVAAAAATPSTPAASAGGKPAQADSASSLPNTGANLGAVVLLAALMMGSGNFLRRRLLRN
jgi:plastocyanin